MANPPRPSESPLIQRLSYMRDPLAYLDKCQRALGDVFTLQLFKKGAVIVCSPELAKEVFTAPDDVLAAGEAKISIFGQILGQSSSVLLDGPEHLKRRRMLLPRFRGEVMKAFGPEMTRECHRMVDAMPKQGTFALHPLMHHTAFHVIATALFSETPDALRGPLLDMLLELANDALNSKLLMFPMLQRDLGRWSPWGKVLRVVARTRAMVMDEIRRRRRERVEASDLVGLLMDARHEDGTPLTDIEVRDEILTMVAAGHETTAMALTWLAYGVFSRPAVLQRLVDELAANPTADLEELPYLDATVRESLRYYSLLAAGSARVAKKPLTLGGHDVPAGSLVLVAIHSIHRRASIFEQPDEFRPERFLGAKHTPYESLPFGGGTRRCLGMPFAMYEIKLVLATLIGRCSLDIVQEHVRASWRGAFLTPSKGLRVQRRPRRARTTAVAAAPGGTPFLAPAGPGADHLRG